jgi:hypothetical protein
MMAWEYLIGLSSAGRGAGALATSCRIPRKMCESVDQL